MRRPHFPFLMLVSMCLCGVAAAAKPEVTILFLGADIREPVNVAADLRPTVTQRRFRIRVDARGISSPRARLFAALSADVPGRRLTVDGIQLATTPRLINARVPLGAAEGHTVEIEMLQPGREVVEETIVWTAEVR